jgi:hypothetical protein
MEHGLRPIAVGIVGTKSRARTQLGKKVVLNSDRDQIRVRLQPRQNQCQTILRQNWCQALTETKPTQNRN